MLLPICGTGTDADHASRYGQHTKDPNIPPRLETRSKPELQRSPTKSDVYLDHANITSTLRHPNSWSPASTLGHSGHKHEIVSVCPLMKDVLTDRAESYHLSVLRSLLSSWCLSYPTLHAKFVAVAFLKRNASMSSAPWTVLVAGVWSSACESQKVSTWDAILFSRPSPTKILVPA